MSATVSYDGASRSAILDPTGGLAFSTVYTATIKGGAGGVKDLAGNAMAADFSWSFTTSAPPPPPPNDGPGGPILVVSSTGNPFSRYYAEILRREGLNAFAVTDLTNVTATLLNSYDVVIIGEIAADGGAGDDVHQLGQRRRQPDRDAARQEAAAAARPDESVVDAEQRVSGG